VTVRPPAASERRLGAEGLSCFAGNCFSYATCPYSSPLAHTRRIGRPNHHAAVNIRSLPKSTPASVRGDNFYAVFPAAPSPAILRSMSASTWRAATGWTLSSPVLTRREKLASTIEASFGDLFIEEGAMTSSSPS
jgi:hypothetical protein